MSKILSFEDFKKRIVKTDWPVTQFWTVFHDAESAGTFMSTDEDILKILRSSSYHPKWKDDYSYRDNYNEEFETAIETENIAYFEPYLNMLFINGYPPKIEPLPEEVVKTSPEPLSEEVNETSPEMKWIKERYIIYKKNNGKEGDADVLNPNVKLKRGDKELNIDEINVGDNIDMIWNDHPNSFLSALNVTVTEIKDETKREVRAGGRRRGKKTTKRKTKGKTTKRKTKGKAKIRRSRRKL